MNPRPGTTRHEYAGRQFNLTPGDRQLLEDLVALHRIKELAARYGRTNGGMRMRLSMLYRKAGFENAVHAVVWYLTKVR